VEHLYGRFSDKLRFSRCRADKKTDTQTTEVAGVGNKLSTDYRPTMRCDKLYLQ